MERSEVARLLAGFRRPKEVTCPVCGKQVVGLGRRKFCSQRCAVRDYYRRHRDEILARKRARRQKTSGPAPAG